MFKTLKRKLENFSKTWGNDHIELWVDRHPPPKDKSDWVWASNYKEAQKYLYNYIVDKASIAYDLEGGNGYWVCLYLIDNPFVLPVYCRIHGTSGERREHMTLALNAAKKRLWGDGSLSYKYNLYRCI